MAETILNIHLIMLYLKISIGFDFGACTVWVGLYFSCSLGLIYFPVRQLFPMLGTHVYALDPNQTHRRTGQCTMNWAAQLLNCGGPIYGCQNHSCG